MRILGQHEGFPEALADPEGLIWQVLNAANSYFSLPPYSLLAPVATQREGKGRVGISPPWITSPVNL
ncbi:hypothetical protein COP2_044813 [Malus domestica]